MFRSIGDGRGKVLFTGYYLPQLHGSLVREGAYQVPLHRAPDDMVQVRSKDFPQLSDDVIGRVVAGRLVPYPTRAEMRSRSSISARSQAARSGTVVWQADSSAMQ